MRRPVSENLTIYRPLCNGPLKSVLSKVSGAE